MININQSISRLALLFFGLCFSISFVACIPDQLKGNNPKQADDSIEQAEKIKPPEITMDLPITLSAVLVNATSSSKTQEKLRSRNASNDPNQCEQYFDPNSDFLENGYNMTRFLIGLSQQQSCVADFIMESIIGQAETWLNKGLISLPVNSDDPNAPSHMQIEQSGDTYQAWLFFATPGTNLPADHSSIQTLYLAWSGSGEEIQGQFYWLNIPLNVDNPDAPAGVRIDFTRSATSADNQIYLKMQPGHSGGISGFRVDVNQTGSGTNATYRAKSLITFIGQPFLNLPEGLDLPEFSVIAVVDATGLGATSANFNKFAVTIKNDSDNNGIIDSSNNEFDLGSYQFDINDTTYFNPILYDITNTTTPYAPQVTEWRRKSVNNATYVADYPRIEVDAPQGLENYTQLKCLERNICDYNGNNILNDNLGEWEGWELGVDYFTSTCTIAQLFPIMIVMLL